VNGPLVLCRLAQTLAGGGGVTDLCDRAAFTSVAACWIDRKRGNKMQRFKYSVIHDSRVVSKMHKKIIVIITLYFLYFTLI